MSQFTCLRTQWILQLQPRFFNTDPNSADAAKRRNHWFRTFETYPKTVESPEPDKLETLIHFVWQLVYNHIADHTDYESAIDTYIIHELKFLAMPNFCTDVLHAKISDVLQHPNSSNCSPILIHLLSLNHRTLLRKLKCRILLNTRWLYNNSGHDPPVIHSTTDDVLNASESNGDTEHPDMTETTRGPWSSKRFANEEHNSFTVNKRVQKLQGDSRYIKRNFDIDPSRLIGI
ncbi:hypothetical protein CLF_110733 [Clonorchis sinensis]|uniref:Uncharacterized protein n=1 Tax=Clonorchis sinensis TaxID=79923 RepID=G7YL31_CLOSI|nr:hypothetical protein CLF_110733 [Clonorchis sinensis]